MSSPISLVSPHKDFESIKKVDENGNEYWEARDLMPILEYTNWRNFDIAIAKSQIACTNSGQEVNDHFAATIKMIIVGKGANRSVKNYKLSRYACYLIAQNSDSSKKSVALAQTYFAIQTRRQEVFEELNAIDKRLYLRGKVRDQNKQLFSTAKKAGVTDFAKFNNAGYQGLYGMTVSKLKKVKGIGKDDVMDRAGSTELAANLFRITQTDEKLKSEKIVGAIKAEITHYQVGRKVRKTIKEIGGTMPEKLKAEPHINKLKKIATRKLLD